jgi:three-Cys-motif partner protein
MEPISKNQAPLWRAGRIASLEMAEELKFEEVGIWSELKLEIIEKYGSAYTKAFARSPNLKKYYIDGFSGAGRHVSKRTKEEIEGSPARALNVKPPFDGFYFVDLNPKKTSYLESLCQGRANTNIVTGDANEHLRSLLPTIQYERFNRALCVLDPYGLHLDWEIMELAGKSRAIDMFLNFPVMDMNRNAIWRHPEKVPPGGVDRMTRFWGDETWRAAAYAEDPQMSFFGPQIVKQSNDAIVAAFAKRLRDVGGFQFVPEPLPMRNANNAVVYYLFFACRHPVAEKIIKEVFDKYRTGLP